MSAAEILLKECHANVNARNRPDDTALNFATDNPVGFFFVVSILPQHGADASPSRGKCPLFCACLRPVSVEVVRQLLLEHGSDAMETRRQRAMHYAAQYSDEATIRLLIAHGADVNWRVYSGSGTSKKGRPKSSGESSRSS